MNTMLRKINFFSALLREAEGEGGGAGAGGGTGAGTGEGAGTAVTGGETSPPASTFLGTGAQGESTVAGGAANDTVAGAAGTETVAGGGDNTEVPAPFDVAALTLPEGVTVDEELGKGFSEILGDTKLSPQERGQKLFDLHTGQLAKVQQDTQTAMAEASAVAFKTMSENWVKETLALPEFKDNPEAERGKVMQAMLAAGADDAFFKALDLTGAGSHPAIARMLHKLSQPFMEGGAVGGNGKTSTKRELGSNIYSSATKPQ